MFQKAVNLSATSKGTQAKGRRLSGSKESKSHLKEELFEEHFSFLLMEERRRGMKEITIIPKKISQREFLIERDGQTSKKLVWPR